MRIAVLVAMDKEMALIKDLMSHIQEMEIGGGKMFRGELNGHEVYLGKCGIGKVNAAVNSYRVISEVTPDLVINSGVAGGAGLPIGTVLVADRVAYSDVWCGPGTEYGEADGFPLYFKPAEIVISAARGIKDSESLAEGLICSSDKFISTHEQIQFIRSHFLDVKAVDMESAAIAQVCAMTSVPFAIVRVVSDTPGEGENISQYKDFWGKAPEKTFNVIRTILSQI